MLENKFTQSKLNKLDITEIYYIYTWITLYVKETISDKFIEIGKVNGGKTIEKEKSIFDEYDEENGYIEKEKEEEKSVYDIYINTLNCTIKYAINSLKNSHKECMECDLSEMLDYIIFDLKYEKEHKENDNNDDDNDDW